MPPKDAGMAVRPVRPTSDIVRSRSDAVYEAFEWRLTDKLEDKPFVLHDGPPYANGKLHCGHALNKVLKDIALRFAVLQGRKIHFVPGWDCHGLPIELKALEAQRSHDQTNVRSNGSGAARKTKRKIDENKRDTPLETTEESLDPSTVVRSVSTDILIRERARDFALSQIDIQRDAFRSWGVLGRWDCPYLTLQPEYEARQLSVFATMLQRGLIYRGLKPVYWSPSSRTALAEAELEYEDAHVSRAAFVAFEIRPGTLSDGVTPPRSVGSSPLSPLPVTQSGERIFAALWTTTPWTIPANLAVAVHPELEYCVIKDPEAPGGGRLFLIARDRLHALCQDDGPWSGTPVARHELEIVADHILGAELVAAGLVCVHPLHPERTSRFVQGNYVTADSGTGLVHTAPGHGVEDFAACTAAGLISAETPEGIMCPVDEDGRFTAEAGPGLTGLSVLREGNAAVLAELRAAGALMHEHDFVHKYPYDWRTRKPLIVRATQQWFADLTSLARLEATKVVADEESLKVFPPRGRTQLLSMLQTRSDWCISRQRAWGVPIPCFFHSETGHVLMTPESIEFVANAVARHPRGTDVWWETLEADTETILVHPKYRHNEDSKGRWVRGRDTMDVWFDSGCSWNSVLSAAGLDGPADVYLEGSDQHRGWFQSSLLTSVAVRGTAPYKNLVTHGFVLDEHGKKMSKSLGNVIDPQEVVGGSPAGRPLPKGGFGLDVLRAWAAHQDSGRDVEIGSTQLKKVADAQSKIRNTLRFCANNLFDIEQPEDLNAQTVALEIDRYIMHLLAEAQAECADAYTSFEPYRVYRTLVNLCTRDLSAFYFPSAKDRLYAEEPSSAFRRSSQFVLLSALDSIIQCLAPIAINAAYEADAVRPGARDEPLGPFRRRWGSAIDAGRWHDAELGRKWRTLRVVRGNMNQEIEVLRAAESSGFRDASGACVTAQIPAGRGGDQLELWLQSLDKSALRGAGGLNDTMGVSSFTVKRVVGGAAVCEPDSESAQLQKILDDPELVAGRVTFLVSSAALHGRTKCPRCWRVCGEHDALCERCKAAVGRHAAENRSTSTSETHALPHLAQDDDGSGDGRNEQAGTSRSRSPAQRVSLFRRLLAQIFG